MQFLQEAHPIPRLLTLRRRYSTTTEKLESIAKMPRPKNQKERVLNKLTRKDEEFKWTPECDK